MTRNDIADYLGLTIETVSRTLTRLKIRGADRHSHPSEIGIRNYDALENLSTGAN